MGHKPSSIKAKAPSRIQTSMDCEDECEDIKAVTHLETLLWRLEQINTHLVKIGNKFNNTYYDLMQTHLSESSVGDDTDDSGTIDRLRTIVDGIECRANYLDNAASRFSEI